MLKFRPLNDQVTDTSPLLLREDLRMEACYDLAQRSITGVSGYLLLWLIIYYASELEQANHALLELLGFLLAAVGVGRLYLALNFKRLYAANPQRWRWMFATGAILLAAIWGGVCVLALNYDGLGATSVMVLLSTAGIASWGIVSLAPATWLGGIFIMFLLFPIVPFALLSGNVPEKGIALLFLTFFIFMIFLWRRLHTEYWRALAGRVELVRAKEAAEAANQAKGEFIANVSHELRTPLTAIIGALGMIESYPPQGMPAQAMTLVDMAFQNGKRLSLLINDILDFEKLNAHRMEFNCQPLALTPFLQRAIELNRSYAESYRVSFVLDLPSSDVEVFADEQRLMQVMTNLLSNAAKHSHAEGKVSISAVRNGDQARISVSDHGSGIPEAFKGHVFERFTQAESSSTRKKNGTGLGLAISKAIVENMGGAIGFESVVEQGTAFFFDIPLAQNPQTSPKISPA